MQAGSYKQSRWAEKILAAQNPDGFWADFHGLATPTRATLTTEQALRRLEVLGFTLEDAPIQKAVDAMADCLHGKRALPGKPDPAYSWDIYTDLMLATWIRRFTPEVESANYVARVWAGIVREAFAAGSYRHTDYLRAARAAFGKKPRGERLLDFVSFYHVSLLANELDEGTERLLFQYVLHYPRGLYPVYHSPGGTAALSLPPAVFACSQTTRYIAALGELARYKRQRGSLQFAAGWLQAHAQNGRWDMGAAARDGVYLPLAGPWHTRAARVADCTAHAGRLLAALESG